MMETTGISALVPLAVALAGDVAGNVVVAVYAAALGVVALLGLQAGLFAVAARRHRAPDLRSVPDDALPRVTVQVPLYNEPAVAARIVRVVCALDYPAGRLDVQILDDSTDATSAIVARTLRAVAPSMPVAHLRRPARDGFKAGALAHGASASDADVFAVFDADFVPAPDTLRRLVPALVRDPGAGCVQARWAHLNDGASWRTRAQALALDLHFGVEHRGRAALGAFVNFNGTAGLWRRAALDDVGGWRDDSIAEDLDLSVRAQLAGWRIAVADAVAVPAELPATVSAWRVQQRRWATGGAEVLGLHARRLATAPLPLGIRTLALAHVGGSTAFVATALVALLHAPAWLVGVPRGVALVGTVGALGYGVAVVAASLHGRATWKERLRSVARAPLFLGAMTALAPSLVPGVVGALRGRRTPFERTDKTGDGGRVGVGGIGRDESVRRSPVGGDGASVAAAFPAPSPKPPRLRPWPWTADAALAAVYAAGWALLWHAGAVDALPLQTLALAGSAALAVAGWAERRAPAPRRTFPAPVAVRSASPTSGPFAAVSSLRECSTSTTP